MITEILEFAACAISKRQKIPVLFPAEAYDWITIDNLWEKSSAIG